MLRKQLSEIYEYIPMEILSSSELLNDIKNPFITTYNQYYKNNKTIIEKIIKNLGYSQVQTYLRKVHIMLDLYFIQAKPQIACEQKYPDCSTCKKRTSNECTPSMNQLLSTRTIISMIISVHIANKIKHNLIKYYGKTFPNSRLYSLLGFKANDPLMDIYFTSYMRIIDFFLEGKTLEWGTYRLDLIISTYSIFNELCCIKNFDYFIECQKTAFYELFAIKIIDSENEKFDFKKIVQKRSKNLLKNTPLKIDMLFRNEKKAIIIFTQAQKNELDQIYLYKHTNKISSIYLQLLIGFTEKGWSTESPDSFY